jgi:APA family basic amino acid/polyamine antiporter
MTADAAAPADAPRLRRALGRWDLTAFGINVVIGGGIFLTPALLATELGNWSLIAIVLVGVAVLCVAVCYAEVGSRFDRTGGPYVYALAAFGPFVAFEVGWMSWFTRVASMAAIVNGCVLALGFFAPGVSAGTPRALLIIGIIVVIAAVNARGIRQSAWLVNTLTIGKLVPLLVFVAAGLFAVDWSRLSPLPPVEATQLGAGGLLLIYAYGGFEVIGVPAGETQDPRRHLAFALVTTIVAVAVLMFLVQIVAMTTLPDITATQTPLADAALRFMGSPGGVLIAVGTLLSMSGNLVGSLLTASRYLFALAETGKLPRFFGRIHPSWQTPANSVWFSSAVALVLALSGSFALLSAVSALARLVTYVAVAAAALRLRQPRFADRVAPAVFVAPFGAITPMIAILVSFAVLYGATGVQLAVGGATLAAGGGLYALMSRGSL